MRYKDIFKKYNITLPDLKKIIRKYNLTREKSEVLKGNKNAKNNKGGHPATENKNAVTTGEYENIYQSVLTEEEKQLFKNMKIESTDKLLDGYIEEYKMLTIRELRMMRRINKLEQSDKDMTVGSIKKKNSQGSIETTTEAEPTIDKIQKIEDSLTRVSEAKRKGRENMIKLGFSKRELELKEKQAENELW
nr:MAG TPA: Small Terminase [Caudoviricetes sp.]DAY61670.1 MAG TPA: Small Terminase [Caudoviricetes sp.]